MTKTEKEKMILCKYSEKCKKYRGPVGRRPRAGDIVQVGSNARDLEPWRRSRVLKENGETFSLCPRWFEKNPPQANEKCIIYKVSETKPRRYLLCVLGTIDRYGFFEEGEFDVVFYAGCELYCGDE